MFVVVVAVGHGCRSGAALPDAARPRAPADALAALTAVEARLERLATAIDTAPRAAHRPCRARAAPPAGVLATPGACTLDQRYQDARVAVHTVVLALVHDLTPLVARLQRLTRGPRLYRDMWKRISLPVLAPTADHLEWMTRSLQRSWYLADRSVNALDHDSHAWAMEQAGRGYEAALLGAQVIAVWVAWLDFAEALYTGTIYDIERILVKLEATWRDIESVLAQLRPADLHEGRPAEPRDIRQVARALPSRLAGWAEGLRAWSEQARRHLRESAELTEKLLLVQAVIELASLRVMVGPRLGTGGALVVVLPGIGGVTAGGAATGVRVVVSAEWVAAMKHLVAIGAITTVEIARLAGITSLASTPPPPAPAPAAPALPGSTSGSRTGHGAARGGRLVVDSVHHSADELRAARHVARQGRDVVLRDPVGRRSKAGGTADLLVDGVPYDVYTPRTANADRIISAIRSKNSQAQGIVLDLTRSKVNIQDLGDVLARLRGAGARNLQEVIIIGR